MAWALRGTQIQVWIEALVPRRRQHLRL